MRIFILDAGHPLARRQELKRASRLALFLLKNGSVVCLQTYPILACLLNPLLFSRSRPLICICRSSTPAVETTTSFSWAHRHILASGRSGGARRRCHPRPSSSTYFLPLVACVCCPPAASSARLLLPAHRAHPATGRPALSPLSPGAARRRGGRRALEAGALEHFLAESLRPLQAGLLGEKFRRLRRARGDHGGRRMALLAPCVWLSYLEFGGTFLRGRCGWSGQKWSKIFLLQKWIDLDELIPTVQSVLKVLHSFDFSLAVDKLAALASTRRAPISLFFAKNEYRTHAVCKRIQ